MMLLTTTGHTAIVETKNEPEQTGNTAPDSHITSGRTHFLPAPGSSVTLKDYEVEEAPSPEPSYPSKHA